MFDAAADEWAALALGLAAVFYSGRVALRFFEVPTYTSQLIGWQLLSQGFLALGALVCALANFGEHWVVVPDWLRSSFRLGLFGFVLVATWRLGRRVS